jgi:hypothetical protein
MTHILEKNIERTRQAMGNYDYNNFFNIVEQDKMPGSSENLVLTKTRDLFKDYAIVTPDEVAWSNKWYRTWTAEIWFEQNLKLSFDFLENHCSEGLWDKTMDKYNRYSEVKKGGPLFFVIMMSKLLSNTEEASDALTKRIGDFKISNLQGENVDKATSLLGGAVKRLAHINRVPQNIFRTMLQIMQTNYVPKFNNTFELMETSRFVNDCEPTLYVWVTGQFNVNTIFSIGEQKYASMMEANQWKGISNKVSKSTFITVGYGKKLVCWNCGGTHRLPECTLPKNQEKISEGKKKMHDAMKKTRRNPGGGANNGNCNGTTTGKFRKPSADEKNCRTIDGNVMFYHKKTERWIPDSFPLGAKVTQEAVAVATVPLTTPPIVRVPPVQINTAISDGHSKTFTKDEISEMKSNLNMIMASQINEYFK